jgi:hypothetical protein
MPKLFASFKFLSMFIFLTSVSSTSFAAFSRDKFTVAVGAEYLSQLDRRGVVTYGSYQVIPIYAIDLFHPSLQLIGSTLNWRQQISDSALYRLRLNFDAANDLPLYYTGENESSRVRRTTASEFETFVEYNPVSFIETTLNVGSGFGGYSGLFGESSIRLKLGKYFERGKGSLVEPALTASVGGGSDEHNRYYYGTGSQAGLSYATFGFSIASPGIIDHFYPWLKVYRSTLLGANRDAAYIKPGEREHWTFLILGAIKIW